MLNQCRYRDPTVFSAWQALRKATIEGAQAVGLGDEVGSSEAGKQADLILVDLTALNLSPVLETPVREPTAGGPPNLVYAGSGHEVVNEHKGPTTEAKGRLYGTGNHMRL